ncbi:MAG TPA: hypothetical protein VMT49_01420 [Steroidobacteraceae bacterium]|nr:hypothetical protein [Steroidobacteraceae bacterium]
MQQASSPLGNFAAPPGNPPRPAASSPRFVVNLCASTTPVGLVQPTHAGLKRFTFFVSRRLEEGRERFRLHMGYFDTQEEAERILDLVRDVYPAAWAGVAPGIKLRARAAAAVGSAPVPEPAAAAATAPPPAPAPVVAAVAAPVEPPSAPPASPAMAASSAATVKLELVPDPPRAIPKPIPELESADHAATPSKAQAARASGDGAARSLSNVRAAIDSLDEVSGDTTVAHVAAAVPAEPALEGAAVLRLLESNPTAPAAKPQAAPSPPRAEPALFAVQLLWSVQPIDMARIPQLAIFSAYTLYGAEGNRDGRRWYGLRLGFFTDAVSAKQVAQYVRSEFTSVSVVPVSVRERARASAATSKPLPAPATAKRTGPELNFIEDVHTDTATSGSRPALQLPEEPKETGPKETAPALAPGVRAAIAAVGMSNRATPGKRAKLRVGQGTKPVSKRPAPRRPLSLEETLEILGAGELQVDNGRGELLNDSSRRERRQVPATPSGSRFGRLINRLAERLGNS